jgi:ABC-type sugar transport system ATPase subunit
MAEIILKNLTKIYSQDVLAVDNINLKINDGEFIVFLGPSGCGKSTTLRMIAGLETISSGEIIIDNNIVNDIDSADRDLAIVFQNYALYPHMTVMGNLSFGLKLRKLPQSEIEKRVFQTADLLDIKPFLDRKPKELSGGQQQRVALGRALVREPVAFLFDEPLSNLDAKLRTLMRIELIKLHRKLKTTTIHVTHDQVEAMTMGERICIIDQGKIIQVGTPIEIYRNPVNTFVAGFLASPSMNLLDGEIIKKNGTINIKIAGEQLSLPDKDFENLKEFNGREIIFGIRPEDLYVEKLFNDMFALDATVITVELLGPETILVSQLVDGKEIYTRLDRNFHAKFDSNIRLFIDIHKIKIFDKASSKVIH